MIKQYLTDIIKLEQEQAEIALKNIYLTYGNQIINTANRVLHDKYQSEEVLNDILLKVWDIADLLVKINNPLGYIITMTYNKAIDYKRKKREIPLEDISIYLDKEMANYYIAKDDFSQIDLILETIPETERTILILRDVYNYSFYEISRDLKISYKQARTRYNKVFLLFKNTYLNWENK